MYTLQEFIRFTKGWEYIIAIAAILLFITFWEVLSGTFFPAFRRVSTRGRQMTESAPAMLVGVSRPKVPAPMMVADAAHNGVHCWEITHCPDEQRAKCQVYAQLAPHRGG